MKCALCSNSFEIKTCVWFLVASVFVLPFTTHYLLFTVFLGDLYGLARDLSCESFFGLAYVNPEEPSFLSPPGSYTNLDRASILSASTRPFHPAPNQQESLLLISLFQSGLLSGLAFVQLMRTHDQCARDSKSLFPLPRQAQPK